MARQFERDENGVIKPIKSEYPALEKGRVNMNAPKGIENPKKEIEDDSGKPIGKEQITKALQTLRRYMSSKKAYDIRYKDNFDTYNLMYTENADRETFKDDDGREHYKLVDENKIGAQTLHTVLNKHADEMDNMPEPFLLPRAADDEDAANILNSVIPSILDRNNFEDIYSKEKTDKLVGGAGVYSVTWNDELVVVEDNILNGVPKRYWVKTVKNTISEKFSNGIPIKGRIIKVNAITRDEFTKSKYSQHQKKYNKNIYKDKFKSANNLDEIIIASTNYVNEDLKHQRKDKFKEFARGDVLVKVGNNDYLAKVIVGITTSKSMVLYDVIDFTSTKFNIKKESTPYGQHKESIRSSMLSKKVDTHIAQQQNKNAESNGTSVSTSNNIPHKSDNVNNNSMQENENNASEIKYAVDDEIDDKYLEAVENNDLETAQKLVDEAAKENGYTIKAYHGTARADRVCFCFRNSRT